MIEATFQLILGKEAELLIFAFIGLICFLISLFLRSKSIQASSGGVAAKTISNSTIITTNSKESAFPILIASLSALFTLGCLILAFLAWQYPVN